MDESEKANQPQPAGQRLKSQYGLVGLFDILGYQAFLENNSARDAVEPVFNTLLDLENKIPTNILEICKSSIAKLKTVERLQHCLKEVKWLIFSDTVLLTVNLDGLQASLTHEVTFLSVCSCLWTTMFNFGLPLRGAITKGDFLLARTCFAGRAITEAHKLASDLDFAGVAIHPEAHEWMQNPIRLELAVPYQLPTKSRGRVEGYILTVPSGRRTAADEPAWDGDLRALVHECFCKHKKTIGRGVSSKLDYTEQLLGFLKLRFPGRFERPL